MDKKYLDIIKSNPERSLTDSKMLRERIENSTAHYHGFTVHTLYMPKMYTPEDYKVFDDAAQMTYKILDKVITEYIKNPRYRALFGFDKRLERLILRPSQYECKIPITRIDLFYNPETHDYKFCEFNTDGSSGMNEDRELNKAFTESETFIEFTKDHNITTFELFDSWVTEFIRIYKSTPNYKHNAHIAIVDFMSSASNEEFDEFARAFERAGYTCEICDIYKLRYENNRLISPSGIQIDAVYRRAVTCDIITNYDKVLPFITAAENNDIVMIGDFRTQIAHNKLLFLLLRHDMTKAILTEAENEFIEHHIPKTYLLTEENIKKYKVYENKTDWIVKPYDSYASKGVFAGIEAKSDKDWQEFIEKHYNEDYLLQEYVPPYETENIDLVWDKSADFAKFVNITGLFVYNGKLKGLYSRTAKTGVISTQYSEMTMPTMIAEKKGL